MYTEQWMNRVREIDPPVAVWEKGRFQYYKAFMIELHFLKTFSVLLLYIITRSGWRTTKQRKRVFVSCVSGMIVIINMHHTLLLHFNTPNSVITFLFTRHKKLLASIWSCVWVHQMNVSLLCSLFSDPRCRLKLVNEPKKSSCGF